jgi:hypothetical protein
MTNRQIDDMSIVLRPVEVPPIGGDIAKLAIALFSVAGVCLTSAFLLLR